METAITVPEFLLNTSWLNTSIGLRPDSDAAPISYPAPTYSAAKGMFEAIQEYQEKFGEYIAPRAGAWIETTKSTSPYKSAKPST